MATINPLRYRGYYYDSETQLYYCLSRYYDPQTGRFISPDSYASTSQGILGNNMYAYCGNNPASRIDDEGEFWHIIAGAAIGAVVSFTSSIIGDVLAGKDIDWAAAGISAAFGAASGALASTGLGAVVQIAGGAALSGAESFIQQGVEKGFDNIDYTAVAPDAILGGLTSVGNGLSKSTSKHLTKQGVNVTNRIVSTFKHDGIKAGFQSIMPATKYYLSQTSTLFYKPLLKSAVDSLVDSFKDSLWDNLAISAS